MTDRIERAWALTWAVWHCWFALPVGRWWRRHRRDADYFGRLGWLVGLVLGVILSMWGTMAK